jgi:hypothetical protein
MDRGIIVNYSAGKHVDEICGSKKRFIPKFYGHASMSKKSKANLNNVAMFALSCTVLLMSMRAGKVMSDPLCLKQGVDFNVSPPPNQITP